MTDTLERIQNEVAREAGFKDFSDAIEGDGYIHKSFVKSIAKLFALECCQATLAKASEKAYLDSIHIRNLYQEPTSIKDTIQDADNIVIL